MEKFQIKLKSIVQYEDKFLVVNRWYDDRISEPFQWEFIDGSLVFGEKPEHGAERLVREQVGLEVYTDRVFYTWSYVVGDTCNVGICFLCRAFDSEVILSEDLRDFEWIVKDDIAGKISNKDVLEDILKAGL